MSGNKRVKLKIKYKRSKRNKFQGDKNRIKTLLHILNSDHKKWIMKLCFISSETLFGAA